ncbi:MAG: hypothetical protein ACE5LU_04575 [Anaerolineae bacterium]
MTLATIYLGSLELLGTISADVQVNGVADYVPAYDQLVRALHAGEDITVAVSDPNVGAWLRRLQDRYTSDRIQIVELTRRQRLREIWNIQVPNWVTEDQIARAQLLNVTISAPPGRDFEDFILEVFFSPFLAQRRLPLRRLDDLLKSHDPRQWSESMDRTLVSDIFRRRLQQWGDQAESPGEKLIIHWLQRSPEELAQKLAVLKVLIGYPPEIGRRVIGDRFDALAQLDLDLSGISVVESQIGSAVDQVRVYLKNLVESNTAHASLEAILEQASGHLEIEFDAVQRLLRSGEVSIDRDLVRRVRGLFAPVQRRPHLDQALADLDLLISQPLPPEPDPDPTNPWGDDQWLEWAEKQYLPYRFWLEEIGQLTGEIVDLANAYADWLYERYPAMRLSSPRMIYRALPALRERMMGDAPVLVLAIDNFNAKFLRDLTRYMRAQGYYAEELNYYVSMLPSCTEVSKKCLLAGQPEPFKATAYEKVVEETWGQTLSGRRVRYLPHIGALRAVRQREHDVYFLNYLPLDMAFHQDEEQVGISHAQAARNYLRAVARDVRAFGERIGAERDLVVIVTSDHGSTRIPAQAPNLIDSAFFAKRVLDKHQRYVRISDSELHALPDNTRYQCYTFERERFGLDENYLAAKRHYRFLPTTGSTYIHGGLTPEETLVPVAVFTPLTVSPKPLTVRLLDREFYYARKSEVRVELVNTNAYPCESVRLEIQNPNVDAPGVELAIMGPMSEEIVTLDGRFRRSQGDIDKLHIRVTYDFLEQPQQQEVEEAVEMKSMMEPAFDLTELL